MFVNFVLIVFTVHADVENKRPAYIDTFVNELINWDAVTARYKAALAWISDIWSVVDYGPNLWDSWSNIQIIYESQV